MSSLNAPPVIADWQNELIVVLQEDGNAKEESRRFRVTIKPALEGRKSTEDHKIDFDNIVDFCKGMKLTEQAQELMVRIRPPLECRLGSILTEIVARRGSGN